jgi:hypothetical protein
VDAGPDEVVAQPRKYFSVHLSGRSDRRHEVGEHPVELRFGHMATYQTELPETNSPMSGFVNSSADINKAVEVARGVNGVRSVKNDMRLK